MEKHNSCQQGRKKVEHSMSSNAGVGGGIERVVVLGGALAVASLIAAFTFKKSNSKDSNTDATNLAATDSCCSKEDEDGNEGLRFILQDSSSTLQQNSCCTNHGTSKIGIIQIETCELVSTQSLITLEDNTMQCERKDSVSGQQEILVHDAEQESTAMTGNYGDIEELLRPVGDNKPINGAENKSNVALVMETIEIEIEDEAVDVDAEQLEAEESSTLKSSMSSVPSNEGEKSSISKGEGDEEDYSVMQSSFSTEEEEDDDDEDEEEEYSPIRSSFSILEDDGIGEEEKEEDEEDSLIKSPLLAEEEDEEEYSPIRWSFSMEEDRIGEEEKEEDEHSPTELSFSTEEEKESPVQSSFSTEEEDENGENVPGIEEEGSEGTRSSSPEPNMEVIYPAEMMGVLSPESKDMNISHRVSVKKSEKDITAKIETYRYLAKTFEERGSNDGKNNKETQEVVVMNDRKEHSAKRLIWVWLGFVLMLLFLLANCLLQRNYLSNSVSFVFPLK